MIDINSLPQWQKDVEITELKSTFEQGASFIFKPRVVDAFQIKIVKVKHEEMFVDETPFFGAKMYYMHQIEQLKSGVRLTNTITVKGFFAWFWVFFVARDIAKSIPNQMDSLVLYIQNKKNNG